MALGSRAFTAVARAVWHLTRDPENKARRLLLTGKSNIAPEQAGLAFTIVAEPGGLPAICWESGAVDMTADDAMRRETGESGEPSCESRLDEAGEWLREALAPGLTRCTELIARAEAEGIGRRTLLRVKQRLGVRSVKRGSDGWYWELPGGESAKSKELQEAQETQETPSVL
jgi:hypothetical protein